MEKNFSLINKKWMVCTSISFLGFFILILSLKHEEQKPGLSSLQGILPTPSTNLNGSVNRIENSIEKSLKSNLEFPERLDGAAPISQVLDRANDNDETSSEAPISQRLDGDDDSSDDDDDDEKSSGVPISQTLGGVEDDNETSIEASIEAFISRALDAVDDDDDEDDEVSSAPIIFQTRDRVDDNNETSSGAPIPQNKTRSAAPPISQTLDKIDNDNEPSSVAPIFQTPDRVDGDNRTCSGAPVSRNETSSKAPIPQNKTSSGAPISQKLEQNETSSEAPISQRLDKVDDDDKTSNGAHNGCNIFEGRWIYDPTYPIYHARQCPFLSDQVNCQKNGRPDYDYARWKWETRECNIPRLDGKELLERWRGKRVVIVGDSLNRNQWESLACILYSVLPPGRASVDVRSAVYKLFRAQDYGCTVEFFWSPFLVPMEEKVIKLHALPPSANNWQGAHIMIFNTGHWWVHGGKFKAKEDHTDQIIERVRLPRFEWLAFLDQCDFQSMFYSQWDFFEYKGRLMEDMEVEKAYKVALKTWAHWIDSNVDPNNTTVFFRSISPEHKSGNQWCYNKTQPNSEETHGDSYPKRLIEILEKTLRHMRVPVKYLNITHLSKYRKDAHTSVYTSRRGKLLSKEQQRQPEAHADCSHWCLPGLPDTWNMLMYIATVFATSPQVF